MLKGSVAFGNQKISVCFTPGGDCTQEIVDTIGSSKKSLYVQAYSFTSKPIIFAIIDAKKRGVEVNVLLDKTQRNGFGEKLLSKNGVFVAIDDRVKIAHNKVMIIDNEEVITGSFNFTTSAQYKNAENVIFIRDSQIANRYLANWFNRQEVSNYEMKFVGIIATRH